MAGQTVPTSGKSKGVYQQVGMLSCLNGLVNNRSRNIQYMVTHDGNHAQRVGASLIEGATQLFRVTGQGNICDGIRGRKIGKALRPNKGGIMPGFFQSNSQRQERLQVTARTISKDAYVHNEILYYT